jgi:hypothetical protein
MSGEPVLQVPELVDGGERGAGVGRLVAQRPVQLGGVADRLVDGQPQVRRVDDEVVAAGLHRRRLGLLRAAARDLGDLARQSQPVPVRYSQPRPPAGRWSLALERAGGAVDGERGESG